MPAFCEGGVQKTSPCTQDNMNAMLEGVTVTGRDGKADVTANVRANG